MSGVTEEMVEAAFKATRQGHDALAPGWMQRALAAAAPLIAAQERAQAIAIAQSEHSDAAQDIDTATQGGDEMGRLQSEGAAHAAARITAAIRALGDAT